MLMIPSPSTRVLSRRGWAWIASLAVLLATLPAHARMRRPLFDPEDLEMEPVGVLDIEATVGPVGDRESMRVFLPDLSIDLGLSAGTEVGFDGGFVVSSPATRLQPLAAEPTDGWLSLKHAVWTSREENATSALAVGLQHGVRLPFAPAATGLGYQALVLAAMRRPGTLVVANVGAFLDPRHAGARAWGMLLGTDGTVDLTADGRWHLDADLSCTVYGRDNTAEVALVAGAQRSWDDRLDVGLSVLTGWVAGGPALGMLVVASPKFRIWR
jgi:hypothetical protein